MSLAVRYTSIWRMYIMGVIPDSQLIVFRSLSFKHTTMPTLLIRISLALLFLSLVQLKSVDADYEQWCIADEQTPDVELQAAIDWACGGGGGADCSKIQMNQPCFSPNTLKDHASYAFNNYYQKFKHKGGSCYFKGAAMITELDPSHGSCKYDYSP